MQSKVPTFTKWLKNSVVLRERCMGTDLVDAGNVERSNGGRCSGAHEEGSYGEGFQGHEVGVASIPFFERHYAASQLENARRSPPPMGPNFDTNTFLFIYLHLIHSQFLCALSLSLLSLYFQLIFPSRKTQKWERVGLLVLLFIFIFFFFVFGLKVKVDLSWIWASTDKNSTRIRPIMKGWLTALFSLKHLHMQDSPIFSFRRNRLVINLSNNLV